MTKQELFHRADSNRGKFQFNGSLECMKHVKFSNVVEEKHTDAYEYMLTQATNQERILSEDIIKQMHYLYYHQVDPNKSGQYRKEPIAALNGHVPPAPEELAQLMEHFISQMENSKRFMHPIEFAAMCLKRLVDIQPFADGNDFVARLFMNFILVREGYSITLIPPEREEEYRSAIIASQTKLYPEIDPLIKLIAECVVESQN
jgi:Fic family protein